MGLTVTLDRAAGKAELRKADWSMSIAIADLPVWVRRYRALWSRKPNRPFGTDTSTPGPWAGFYEHDLRALERATKEAGI